MDPQKKILLTMTYPMNAGRDFEEILLVIDALQTADAQYIAPVVKRAAKNSASTTAKAKAPER